MDASKTHKQMAMSLQEAKSQCLKALRNTIVNGRCSQKLILLAGDISLQACAHFDVQWHFSFLEQQQRSPSIGGCFANQHSSVLSDVYSRTEHVFDDMQMKRFVQLVVCAALSISSSVLRERVENPSRLVSAIMGKSGIAEKLKTVQQMAMRIWIDCFGAQLENIQSIFLDVVRLSLRFFGTDRFDAASVVDNIVSDGIFERLQFPIATMLYKRYQHRQMAMAILCMYAPLVFQTLSTPRQRKKTLATMADIALIDGQPQSLTCVIGCTKLVLQDRELVRAPSVTQIRKHCLLWLNHYVLDCRESLEVATDKWRSMRRLDRDYIVCRRQRQPLIENDTRCVLWTQAEMAEHLQRPALGKTMLGEGSYGQVHRMAVMCEEMSFVEQLARFCGMMDVDSPKRFVNAEQIALKTFKSPVDFFATSDSFVESSALLSLNHPNIVQAHKIILVVDGDTSRSELPTLAACMPLYDATLHSVIKRQKTMRKVKSPTSIFETTQMFASHVAQLYDALDFMHKRGYMHNDIKCGNILVKFDGRSDRVRRLALADFGGTSFMFPLTQKQCNASEVTTVCWRAPEKVLQQTHLHYAGRPYLVSAACDLWSMAVVTVEMLLCERMLFGTKNFAESELLSIQWKACGHMLTDEEKKAFFIMCASHAMQTRLQKIGFDLNIVYNRVCRALSGHPETFAFIFERMLHLLPTERVPADKVSSHFRRLSATAF